MLADDVVATAGTVDDVIYRGAFTALAKQVRAAQRFDLSPEVMRSAFTISHSPIGPQLRVLALCKFPFRRCWFEWPGGFAGTPSVRTDTNAPVPKRMGALIEADASLQRGTIAYAWLHPDQGVNLCPLLITFDWREHGEPVADLTNSAHWHEQRSEAEWCDLAAKYPRVGMSRRDDVIADNQRFGVIVNPIMQGFLDAASTRRGALDLILNASVKDVEGEPPMLRAAIMLLNSRNLAEHEPRPIAAKLNRARARSGKAPLLDYTHVRVRLTRALAARAGMAADARNPARLHLVRGHFKIRRTGIYWWSPFARGAADTTHPIRQQQRHVAM
jgi:hypothetical protein